MFSDIDVLVAQGAYEKALAAAKRLSIERLKANQRGAAGLALARAAEILCALNHPSKARSFAWEALDLARKADDALARGYALAMQALACLRLGDIDLAEQGVDASLDLLARVKDHEAAASAKLVAAEVALSQDDHVEARAFAEDAYAIAASLGRRDLKARACLVKALAEERAGSPAAALELLGAADAELAKAPHLETQWQVKAALAGLHHKQMRLKVAQTLRNEAGELLQKVILGLSPESRDRFLKHPSVVAALGRDQTESGIFKAPLQPPKAAPALRRDDFALAGLRPVFEVIKKINSEPNVRKLLAMILDTMIEFCNAQRGTIVVFERDQFKTELSRSREKQDLKAEEMGLSRDVLRRVRDTGKRITADLATEDPTLKLSDSVQDQHLQSILCVPLRVKLRLIGAVYLDNPYVVGAFGPREIELAEVLTDHAAVAIDNALLRAKSIHDGLTHVFNHPHFEKRVEAEVSRARRHGRPVSLMMIDMDDFKGINDTLGHEAGNEALRIVAKILVSAVRTADVVARVQEAETEGAAAVARYGGDEFEVILPDAGPPGLRTVAERVLQLAKETPFRWNEQPHFLKLSIGGASFPDDAKDFRELMLRADEALYAAKHGGKGRFVAYRPGTSAKAPAGA